MEIEPIAVAHCALKSKFGAPRQPGLVPSLRARIVFGEKFRDESALRGIEGFSHLWILWLFSLNRSAATSPTVRPPRLGGNTRMGVFATRSPFRPNPIGLSCVKLEAVTRDPNDGPVLEVSGADFVDGTPIVDIKPYVPYADRPENPTGGFAADAPMAPLSVEIPARLLSMIPQGERETLQGVLATDPRPAYQRDPGRTYGMTFGDFDVRFSVNGDVLTVSDIVPAELR